MAIFQSRLGCSSISFRHQDLPTALTTIRGLGFEEIDLGALPGVCDHVPYVLDSQSVHAVATDVLASGLRVRTVNGDIGDLNQQLTDAEQQSRMDHLDMLLTLTDAIGGRALVLPCGAIDHNPVRSLDEDLDLVASQLSAAAQRADAFGIEVWTESLHFFRLCYNIERAEQLTQRLAGSGVRLVMDFSHITASGSNPRDYVDRFADQIAHVHLRDAVPGNIHLSVGNGSADFAGGLRALAEAGYTGHFALELETRDISNDERPEATARAGAFITPLI